MKHGLKEYFSKKTDKEIFAILLFFSCLILMTVLAVFRFCGIGYFANEHAEYVEKVAKVKYALDMAKK